MAGFNSTLEGRSSTTSSKGASQHLAASTKMAYKRRRASRRVPTTILETSCQEFRDAVQKLTGFHRPAAASVAPPPATAAPLPVPLQPKMSSASYDDEDESYDAYEAYDAYDAYDPRDGSRRSPQSVLSESASGELSDGEFFQKFLRDAARQRFPYGPGLRPPYRPAPAAPGPAGAMFGAPAGQSLWDEIGGDLMSSVAKLQDPSLGANPYLIALENQLLAKFARRMQFAASNPLDPWYQMDQMTNPMRA